MFAYIKGLLIQATPVYAIVETGGVGYKIFIPATLLAKLPQIQEQVILYTSFVIRENSQALYGFLTHQDLDLFDALLNVSGIGPKTALSLIGHLSIQDLQAAVHHNDITTISKVPGIGKKTAERLIIEMRDKMAAFAPTDPSDFVVRVKDPHAQKINDAMSALINLGYNQITAQKAIKKTLKDNSEDLELSDLITSALQNL